VRLVALLVLSIVSISGASIHLNVFPPINIDLYKTTWVSLSKTLEKKYRFYVGLTAEIVVVRVEGPNLAPQQILHVCVSLSSFNIHI
jgi:hypothetical protein